jgi:molybdopterin adenylyltransferase
MEPNRRAGILTVSDGVFHGTRTDDSGRSLAELLTGAGFEVVDAAVVADEVPDIEAAIRRMASVANLVVTTGGTGFGPRDVTPEATKAVIDREAPGLAETMRAVGRLSSPMAIISRGVTGVVGSALVLNLPGSPKGAVESLSTVMAVVPHALQLLAGDTQHSAGETSLPAGPASAAGSEKAGGHSHGVPGTEAHDHPPEGGQTGAGAGSSTSAGGSPAAPDPHDQGDTGVGPTDVTLDLARHLAGGGEVLLATAIRTDGAPPCRPGQKLLLGPGGPLSGTLGCSEFDVSAAADAVDVLSTGRPLLKTYHHDLGSVEVYLEPYRHRPRLVVLSATPIALWLLRWGRDLGYETILIESRSEWITSEHREAAMRVVGTAGALGTVPTGSVPGAEMEVVATDHDAPDVAEVVAALLPSRPRFVGIMGSARHTGHHLAALRERGVPEEEVAKIQSPVGLNLGARTPPEIALSILGGLMAARTGRPGGWIDTRTQV